MRNFKLMILVIMSSLITNACSDDEGITRSDPASRNETVTFGRYFDNCQGDSCIEIFMLQGDMLKEDVSGEKPFKGYFFSGDFIDFKGASSIKMRDLLLEFPDELLSTTATYNVLGGSSTGDWGAIYLEYHNNNIHKQFIIDTDIDNLPEYLREYIKIIDDTIDQLVK